MEYKKEDWVPVDLTGMYFTDLLCILKLGGNTLDFYFPTNFKPDLPNGTYRITYQYSTYDEESGYSGDEKPMQFEIMYLNS